MPLKFTRLAIAIAVFSATAHAQNATVVNIETIEVIGQAIPDTVTHVDMGHLAPGKETADSLRDFLGVSGSRMGGHGIDPTIRGLNQTQLNVLLDGAYIHGGCPNRMDPPTSYAAATGFEEVTIIRGTQTLAYGGGGPGGTLLFSRITEPFLENAVRGELSAAWRSNSNTQDLGLDIAAGGRHGYVRLLAGHSDSGNYVDGNGDAIRTAYEERAGTLILGYTPTADSRYEFSIDRQNTLDALFPGAGMDSPDASNTTMRIKAEVGDIGPLHLIRGELYASSVDHVMDSYTLRPQALMRMRAPSTSDTVGGRLVSDFSSDWGTWTLGIDGQYNQRKAERYNDGGAEPMLNAVLWPDVSIDQTGVFAELSHELAQAWTLKSGLRLDLVRSNAADTEIKPAGMALSPAQLYALYYDEPAVSQTDHNLGALLRVEYAPDSRGRWYAGLARSVRTPDATERYIASNAPMPSGRWVGNPALDPETHHQVEVGFIQRWHRTHLDVALYANRVSDYVLRDRHVEAMNYASIYRNVDALLMGTEVQLQVTMTPSLTMELGAAMVRGENRTDDRALAQIPPIEGFLGLNWQQGAWQGRARVDWADQQHRVDTASSSGIEGQGLDVRATPGWGILNLNVSYRASDGIQLRGGIDNAFDKAYAQHLNRGNAFDPTQIQVNEAGRSVWLGITITL